MAAKRALIALAVARALLPASFVTNTIPVFRSTAVFTPDLWFREATVSLSQSPTRILVSTTTGRSSIDMPSNFGVLPHRRMPFAKRRFRLFRRYGRKSSLPARTSPHPSALICAYTYWYTASCDTRIPGMSMRIRPAICSGDQRSFRRRTTYARTASSFSRSFLPPSFRFSSARSWATRGVYRFWNTGLFRAISRDTDDGERLRVRAIARTDHFFQRSFCIVPRSSIENYLYCMP